MVRGLGVVSLRRRPRSLSAGDLEIRIQPSPAASPLRTDFPARPKAAPKTRGGAHEPLTQIKQFLSAAHHLLSK